MFRRTRYQFGCLELKPRKKGSDVWVLRYRVQQPDGSVKLANVRVGTIEQYPSKASARKAAESLLLMLNPDYPTQNTVTFGALVDRYMAEELPERHSTRVSCLSYLRNHIKPKWANYPLGMVRPFAVEQWLKQVNLAPKSKAHIKNIMRVLFNCAMRWEIIEIRENPMRLVRVKDATKRKKEPLVLTPPQFCLYLEQVKAEPCRTMVIVAMCLGLRVSELAALKWSDLDWDGLRLMVQRAVVAGRVGDVKTQYSQKRMPLDPALAEVLLNWKMQSRFSKDTDWVFASPYQNGRLPHTPWNLQQRYLKPAAERAGLGKGIGWHTFRHSYSTMLRQLGVDVKVQQELLRHSDIRTTLNVYTQGVPEDLREANRKVVAMVLPSKTP